jgi:hypothetical protein
LAVAVFSTFRWQWRYQLAWSIMSFVICTYSFHSRWTRSIADWNSLLPSLVAFELIAIIVYGVSSQDRLWMPRPEFNYLSYSFWIEFAALFLALIAGKSRSCCDAGGEKMRDACSVKVFSSLLRLDIFVNRTMMVSMRSSTRMNTAIHPRMVLTCNWLMAVVAFLNRNYNSLYLSFTRLRSIHSVDFSLCFLGSVDTFHCSYLFDENVKFSSFSISISFRPCLFSSRDTPIFSNRPFFLLYNLLFDTDRMMTSDQSMYITSVK